MSNIIRNKIKKNYSGLNFELNIKRHKNYKYYDKIISVCFFRMQTKEYKSSELYINGLQNIINKINKMDWNLRIYYDTSVIYKKYGDKKIQNDIKKNRRVLINGLKTKKCELYRYHFPDFIKNKIYHSGIFGMFVRFMPLFDFEFEKSKAVYISDIDGFYYPRFRNIINDFIKSPKYELLYRSTLCYNLNYYGSYIQHDIYFPIASFYISKIKMDHNLFIKFLLDMKYFRNDYKRYIEMYDSENKKYVETKLKTIGKLPDGKEKEARLKYLNITLKKIEANKKGHIPYGADEFFLTGMTNMLINKKNKRYILILRLTLLHILKHLRYYNNYFEELKKDRNENLNIFFESIMKDIDIFTKNDHKMNFGKLKQKIIRDKDSNKYSYIFLKNYMAFNKNNKKIMESINLDEKITRCIIPYYRYKKEHIKIDETDKRKIIYVEDV